MLRAKRDIYREGVWCIADAESDKYSALKVKSQAAVPWADQALYAKYMVYYCVCVIALFVMKKILFMCLDRSNETHSFKGCRALAQKIIALNRYISYRKLPIQVCTYLGLPSSAGNTIVILVSSLYVLCLTFIPKFWYRACRGFGSPPLAVRAGLEATAFIPFILVLSGKTNSISWMTGISYEKLNVMHRWLSFLTYLLAWVHIIPFYYQAAYEGGSERIAYFQANESLFVNGIPPTVFLTWLCIGSHTSLRSWCYELFIHMHWLCGVGFCISLYIHIYPELGSQDYMYATVALWGSQVIYRVLTKTAMRPGMRFLKQQKAKACKYLLRSSTPTNDECFEVVIENPNNQFNWKPGQHFFLRVPGLRILDNHPFSICNIPVDDTGSMRFIIKPKKGLTKELYEKIPESMTTEIGIYLDGPYGGSDRAIDSFTDIFLFATGTGVSAVTSFLLDFASRAEKSSFSNSASLYWVVKHEEDISWIEDELRSIPKSMVEGGRIKIYIYVCEETVSVIDIDSSKTSSKDSLIAKSVSKEQRWEIVNYKPSCRMLVQNVKAQLGRKNMFVCSGSESMKFDVGNGVASLQTAIWSTDSHVEEVYLHTENFGW